MAQQKAKYWVAILYPESMKQGWQDDIDDIIELPYAYCVHDQDLDKDGDDRKAHVHLMIAFPNTTTYNHALQIFAELSADGKTAVSTCKRVISVRRMYNYLIHDTDDCRKKGKHEYGKDERITGNNFDIGAYEQIGAEEKAQLRRSLSALLLEKGFTTYASFYEYVDKNYESECENIVVTYQGHFDKLCKGCFHRLEMKKKVEEYERKREGAN